MTENYLQTIWAQKRLPNLNLKLVDGRDITINEFGVHNEQLAGPDFAMGAVTIDELKWVGHIEIHVISSDWYRHKHHVDQNYDNTVLHVVYEHDEQVRQNGRLLPTLELKSYIDIEHYEKWKFKTLARKKFPCSSSLTILDPIYLSAMKDKALIDKLNNKVNELSSHKLRSEEAVFYYLLASAFGGVANKVGFEVLATRIPFSVLKELSPVQRIRLLVSESGVVQAETSSERTYWNFKGVYPASFPSVRVRQFAQLIATYSTDWLVKIKAARTNRDELRFLVAQHGDDFKSTTLPLSKGFIDHIIINAIIPFYWMLHDAYQDDSFMESALQLLSELPKERNAVIRKWLKEGVEIKNAYDTQSLLAIYRYFCCRKKCLSCEVGVKILNRQE